MPATYPAIIKKIKGKLVPFVVLVLYAFTTLIGHDNPKHSRVKNQTPQRGERRPKRNLHNSARHPNSARFPGNYPQTDHLQILRPC